MAMAFGIALIHDADNANLRIMDANEKSEKDSYFLPTYELGSDGIMRVNNKRTRGYNSKKYDPLGLGINKGILGNL